MKVYKIKEQRETTYISFDGDKNEALDWYIEETMCDENEIDSIEEFPQEKWKEVTINYDEDYIEHFSISLEEAMVGANYPNILCSTAYL